MCKHKGPGKFSSCTDEYLYHLSPNEEINIGDTWYGRIEFPFLDQINDDDVYAGSILYDIGHTFSHEERECILSDLKINYYPGVIVEEIDTGFVNVHYYNSKHDLELDWDNILAEAEEYHSGEED